MDNRPCRKLVFLYVAGFLAAGSTWAQTPYLAKGNQEANVFGGLSYGLDHWRGSFGGNYAVAPFNKFLMLYGEYSYFPGIERKTGPVIASSGVPIAESSTTSSRFQDIHAGVHLRLPIFPEKRIVPYLAGGVGLLREDPSGTLYIPSPFPIATASVNHFAINAGGGIRVYLTGDGRFGFRLEAKTYKPFGSNSGIVSVRPDAFGKVSLGVFYQFK